MSSHQEITNTLPSQAESNVSNHEVSGSICADSHVSTCEVSGEICAESNVSNHEDSEGICDESNVLKCEESELQASITEKSLVHPYFPVSNGPNKSSSHDNPMDDSSATSLEAAAPVRNNTER